MPMSRWPGTAPLLDNLEHLPGGALLPLIIRPPEHAPGGRLIITSRERLNPRAETLLDHQ